MLSVFRGHMNLRANTFEFFCATDMLMDHGHQLALLSWKLSDWR